MFDPTKRQEIRRINIDFDALCTAFDNTGPEMRWYLDLETGEVPLVTDESRDALAQISEEIGDDADEASFRAALEQSDLSDWERDMALETYQIEVGFGTRYIEIPGTDSHTGYAEMEDFIETVADDQVRRRLI